MVLTGYVHKVRFLNFIFVLEFPERDTIFNRLRAINYCVNAELLRYVHSRDITSDMIKLTIVRYFFNIQVYVDVQKFSELSEVILLSFRNISMSCEYPFKNTELGIWRIALAYLKMCISLCLYDSP